MLISFDTPWGETCVILWGKLRSGFQDFPAIRTMTNEQTGLTTDRFSVNVSVTKEGSGKNLKWNFTSEQCIMFSKDGDAARKKLHQVLMLLKPKDMVLILGHREIRKFKKSNGTVEEVPTTMVDALVPLGWTYDLLIAFYTKVVNQEAKERITTLKPKDHPRVQRPVFIDEKDGAYFE